MARCGCASGCACSVVQGPGVTVTGTGSPANPYVISAGDAVPTTVTDLDTPTVDTVVTGGPAYVVSGNVKISASPNNCLDANADGLFVACPDGSETIVQQGANVTVTGSGTVADPYIVSSTGGGGGGGTPLAVTDTSTVNLTINPALPQNLSADVKISAAPGNTVTVNADGLFVPASPAPVEVDCGIKGSGTVADPLMANVATAPLSPLATETGAMPGAPFACPVSAYADVVCDPATGQLHAPPEHTAIAGVFTGTPANVQNGGAGLPVNISLFQRAQSINVNIANPSPCRAMQLLVTIRTEIRLANVPDTAGYVVQTEENGNSGATPAPGSVNPQPLEALSIQTDNGVRVRAGLTYQLIEHTTIFIPPGGTYNFITFVDVSPRGAAGGQVIVAAQRAHYIGVTV